MHLSKALMVLFFVINNVYAQEGHQETQGFYDATGLWFPPTTTVHYVPADQLNRYAQMMPGVPLMPIPVIEEQTSWEQVYTIPLSLDELFGRDFHEEKVKRDEPEMCPSLHDSEIEEDLARIEEQNFYEGYTYKPAQVVTKKTDLEYKIEREQREKREREQQRRRQLDQARKKKNNTRKSSKKSPKQIKKEKQRNDEALLSQYIEKNKSLARPSTPESKPKRTVAQLRKQKDLERGEVVQRARETINGLHSLVNYADVQMLVEGGRMLAQAYDIASTQPFEALELLCTIKKTGLFKVLSSNPQLLIQGWQAIDLIHDAAYDSPVVGLQFSEELIEKVESFYEPFLAAQKLRLEECKPTIYDHYLHAYNLCRTMMDIKDTQDQEIKKMRLDELVDMLNALGICGVECGKELPLDEFFEKVNEAVQQYYDGMSAQCEHLFAKDKKTINVVLK